MSAQPRYPTLQFIAQFGGPIVVVTAALPFLGAVAGVLAGLPWWLALAGIVASAYAFLFLRSYVELIRAVADTLLPR